MSASNVVARQRDFEQRLRPHLRGLQAYARRLCGCAADAEDLVQDVLLKLYEKSDRLTHIEELRPWLMRVVYYRFVDLCRQRDARLICYQHELDLNDDGHADFTEQVPAADPGPEAEVEHSQLRDWLYRSIARLPEAQREVARLYELQGQSLAEIAEQRCLSINTLKSSLLRARQNLYGHAAASARIGSSPGLVRRYGNVQRRRKRPRDRSRDRMLAG